MEKGTSLLAKSLPPEYEDFYLRRIIISITKRLEALQPLLLEDTDRDKDQGQEDEGLQEALGPTCDKLSLQENLDEQ